MPTNAESELRSRINNLLSEPLRSAQIREREAFPAHLKQSDGSIVFFGAGRMGRLCLRAVRRGGLRVRAFCDRNPALLGTDLDGSIVLAPEEAARRFGDTALFVVSIWTGTAHESMSERMDYLRKLGCRRTVSYAPLLWSLGRDELPVHSFDLPSRVLENAAALRALARLLLDEISLETLSAILRQRLQGEFGRSRPAAGQYFPSDVISLRGDEIFVDGGAFTGDTLTTFLSHTGSNFGEFHAIEPDSFNEKKLRQLIAELPDVSRSKIHVHPLALHACNETLAFDGSGNATSKIMVGGSRRVSARTLDSLLSGRRITFLKLDVEGAERAVLLGARSVISSSQPIAAVCVYHAPSDLWDIPLFLSELLPKHRFFLRQHQFDGYELVVYAVPVGRCVPGN